jgi:TonB family protein
VQPAAAVVAKRSNVRSLVAAAAVVAIVAVIGVPLSRLWLERGVAQPVPQQQAVPHPAPAPKPAPRPTAPAAAAATAPAVTAAHAPEEKPQPAAAAALPQPTAAARVRPTAPAATTRVGGNVSRPSTHAAPPPAALAALAPTVEVPSATALAATTAATEAPAPLPAAAPAPAAGPFYELNDVDRPPQALTKVDVTIPASLQDRSVNEIAVVRVLVAQTGRPVLVSLLRRSKAGLALDEAVIAAVKQWTFTPAVKRGQNVSCFYHVAVTVR